MPESPRPKWLQVHLSTAVVLMFAATALLWINVREQAVVDTEILLPSGFHPNAKYNGWPFIFNEYVIAPVKVPVGWDGKEPLVTSIESRIIWFDATLDVFVGLILLAALWFLCEWQIRRHRERNPPPKIP
jgi:hypothetical protein